MLKFKHVPKVLSAIEQLYEESVFSLLSEDSGNVSIDKKVGTII